MIRSISYLIGGTAASQLIILASLPFLTRIYSPQDFNALAIYVAIITMVSVVACMRMEIAIPLAENDDDAINVFAISCSFTVLITVFLSAVVILYKKYLYPIESFSSILGSEWLLPFGIFLIGMYTSLQHWFMRRKRFLIIAKNRVIQSLSGVSFQLVWGLMVSSPFGLMLGHAIVSGSGFFLLLYRMLSIDRHLLGRVRIKRMRELLHSNKNFPTYSVIDGLSTNAALQLPVILIGLYVVGPEAGYLFLATRVVGAPLQLIGGAISQVYLSQSADSLRNGSLGVVTARIVRLLVVVGVLPLCIFGLIAANFFSIAFGSDWERAGVMASWMVPWYAFRFLASPISMVMNTVGKQKKMMYMKMVALTIRVGLVFLSVKFFPIYVVEILCISSAAVYFVFFSIFYRESQANFRDVFSVKSWKSDFNELTSRGRRNAK